MHVITSEKKVVNVDSFTIHVLDHMGFDSSRRSGLSEDQYLRINSLILSANGAPVTAIKKKVETIFSLRS